MRTVAGDVRPTTPRSRPMVGASRKWGSADTAAADVSPSTPASATAPWTRSTTASESAPRTFAARASSSADVAVELKGRLRAVRGLPRALALDVAQVVGARAGHDGPAPACELAVERPAALDDEAPLALPDAARQALETGER